MEDEADGLAELLPLMEDEIVGVFDTLIEGDDEPLLFILVEGDAELVILVETVTEVLLEGDDELLLD